MKSSAGQMRVVRRKLADGSVKEYRYARSSGKREPRNVAGSVASLIRAYERSPEWEILRPATHKSYRHFFRDIETLGNRMAAEVRRRDILTLRDAIASSRGHGAANVFIRTCGALYKWAVEREIVEHSPVTKIASLPGGHLLAWTEAEADLACEKLPEAIRRVIVLARYTAQRRGDLIAMRWASYDGSAIRLTQEKARTKVEMVIPVHKALRAEMDAWRSEAAAFPLPSVHILTSLTGLPWTASNLTHAMAREVALIPGLRPKLNVHGLRKLGATSLAEAGCTTHEISAITGHKSLAMVALYTQSVEQRRLGKSAIGKLEAKGR